MPCSRTPEDKPNSMKLSLYSDDLLHAPVDVIALGAFADAEGPTPTFAALDQSLDGALAQACKDEDFKGKPGQHVVFNLPPGRPARRVVVCGLGPGREYGLDATRSYAGCAARAAAKVGAQSMAIDVVPADGAPILGRVQALAEGVWLGSYRFDELRTRDVKPLSLQTVHVGLDAKAVAGLTGANLKSALERGEKVAEGVRLARDLTNLPPNVLHPVELADRARKVARSYDLGFKVLTPKEMERQNMHLHLGVGQGSRNEPRLIHLTYEPTGAGEDVPVLAFVGKGITFDAGGLSLKTGEGMVEMKIDMGGAAAVLGAMQAVAALKPRVRVHGIIGAAENMPDGNAIRPGDVIKSKKGITVEILNTDAEGRLVLADALAYAQELRPTHVVDLATLTGACMVALGRSRAAAYYEDGPMAQAFEAAWNRSEELFWRMPLSAELREVLKSEVADIKNIGDRWGGSITAALFLKEFVDEGMSWAHLDIAGPVFAQSEGPVGPKGGTGFGVRTLVELARELSGEVPGTEP